MNECKDIKLVAPPGLEDVFLDAEDLDGQENFDPSNKENTDGASKIIKKVNDYIP
jgi:hypothetical protein